MIPQVADSLKSVSIKVYPSLTYRLDMDTGRVRGRVDGIDAIRQSVYKIISTERYAYLIYTWNYGIELERFIGSDYDFVSSDMERTITEALIQDDRILGIKDFSINRTGPDKVHIMFTVESVEGEVRIEEEVQL